MKEKAEKFKKKRRKSAARRFNSYLKAIRKKKLADKIYSMYDREFSYYDNLHQYSKNKIHCSCPMCSPKTRNKGRRNRKNYARSINYKHSDLVKQIGMDGQIEDYFGVKIHRKVKN